MLVIAPNLGLQIGPQFVEYRLRVWREAKVACSIRVSLLDLQGVQLVEHGIDSRTGERILGPVKVAPFLRQVGPKREDRSATFASNCVRYVVPKRSRLRAAEGRTCRSPCRSKLAGRSSVLVVEHSKERNMLTTPHEFDGRLAWSVFPQ